MRNKCVPFSVKLITVFDPLNFFGKRIAEYGAHSALYIDNGDEKLLFDPAGSFKAGERGSGDFFDGGGGTLSEYRAYHQGNGSRVEIQTFTVSVLNATTMIDRVYQQNGAPPFACAAASSGILDGLGQFSDLGIKWTPGGLSDAVRN